MTKKMLIDGANDEEIRLAIINEEQQLEDYDHEITAHASLKGNVYLAKVTRVEPSLQAAFIDYGNERHGFLSFSEIHPDYYRIPTADKEKLLEIEKDDEEISIDIDHIKEDDQTDESDDNKEDDHTNESDDQQKEDDDEQDDHVTHAEELEKTDEYEESIEEKQKMLAKERRRKYAKIRQHYRIQEVIKAGQVLLVQVVKDERGQKGAALTTYLSLAGRYCVLMPNTIKAGGISRRIVNVKDRKRLKEIVASLNVAPNMGVILRTAGSQRSSIEIKRDFEYLGYLWDKVRELTLSSIAPCLINEEASLSKRAIRDLYHRDISEIHVEGENTYKVVRETLKEMIPSHVKKLKKFKAENGKAIFSSFQVEKQIEDIHRSQVSMKAGGFLVINQTEALVAIDVNSGRSIKERNIEETALKTNLEAVDEVCRQLRLRDLSGLIVIDFIDMEEKQNIFAVENRMREMLKNDRARIQNNRISMFGLMEMSRQRLRPSLFETTHKKCNYCNGTGFTVGPYQQGVDIIRKLLSKIAQIKEENLEKNISIRIELKTYLLEYFLSHFIDKIQQIRNEHHVELEFALIDDAKNMNFNIHVEGLEQESRTKKNKDRKKQKRNHDNKRTTKNEQNQNDEAHQTQEDDHVSSSNNDQNAIASEKEKGAKKRNKRHHKKHNTEKNNAEENSNAQIASSHENDEAHKMHAPEVDAPTQEKLHDDPSSTMTKGKKAPARKKPTHKTSTTKLANQENAIKEKQVEENHDRGENIDHKTTDQEDEAKKAPAKKVAAKKTSAKKVAAKKASAKEAPAKKAAAKEAPVKKIAAKKASAKKVAAKDNSVENVSENVSIEQHNVKETVPNSIEEKKETRKKKKGGWWNILSS